METISKKSYHSPQIICIALDNEIALVMMTGETDPGGQPGGNAPAAAASAGTVKKKTTTTSSFQKNPFNETE